VDIRFTVDGLEEIVWWVLSYGPHCRVMEPGELRERVRRLQQSAAAQYPTDGMSSVPRDTPSA
jgi:predicted DNA-binding transcriptional regulator YafY